jgi:ABC-type transport system involved in cytochrome c biogenesis permease subunit
MKRWRSIAIGIDLIIIGYLVGLQTVLTIQTSSAIAAFEARTGGTADNDWGQRGLAIGFVVLLVALYLAAESIRQLSRAHASGFVLYSLLWLLMVPVLALALLPEGLEIFRSSMQLLCVAGSVSGMVLGISAARSSRINQRASPVP